MAGLQQVTKVQDLSDGPLFLLASGSIKETVEEPQSFSLLFYLTPSLLKKRWELGREMQ